MRDCQHADDRWRFEIDDVVGKRFTGARRTCRSTGTRRTSEPALGRLAICSTVASTASKKSMPKPTPRSSYHVRRRNIRVGSSSKRAGFVTACAVQPRPAVARLPAGCPRIGRSARGAHVFRFRLPRPPRFLGRDVLVIEAREKLGGHVRALGHGKREGFTKTVLRALRHVGILATSLLSNSRCSRRAAPMLCQDSARSGTSCRFAARG